jgi:hypothetical protein
MIKEFKKEFSQVQKMAEEVVVARQNSLRISTTNLQSVLDSHSEYFNEVSSMWARVNFFVKRVKQYFDELEAEISIQIRKDPAHFGMDKVTENAITAYLKTDEDLSTLRELRYNAEFCLEELQGLMNAYEHRRSMINNAVDLLKAGLFDSVTASAKVDDYKENIRRAKRRGDSTEE